MLADEFDTRIERIRGDLMKPQGIDLLLVYADDIFRPGNVRYLTDFDVYAIYAMVVVPCVGEISLTFGFHHTAYLVRVKEVARAGYITPTKRPEDHCRELIEELGIDQPRIGLVGAREMLHSIRAGLDSELPGASFHDLTADFESIRRVKSAAEIACLRRSASIADQGLRALKEHLNAGNTELNVVKEGGLAARRAGADVLTREIVGFQVATGNAVLRSLGPATNRVLRKGDAFAVEVSPQFEGYRTVLGRTYAIGNTGPEEKELSSRVAFTHRRICESIVPGIGACDIARAAEDLLENAGLRKYVCRGLGHGVGLDPEESPRLDLNDSTVVEPGMALAVRTSVICPGVGGAFFADTVLVAEDKGIILSELPENYT